jgi:hypothetical protein
MIEPPFIMPERDLGDGVTASFDGYHIWLTAERDGMTHAIALEPAVFDALHCYEQDIRTAYEAHQQAKDPPS